MESHKLMFELSHPERLKILQILRKKPMRLSHLSKELDVTTAEVSRHLDRLGKARLIDRDSNSNYNLTPFALIILSEVSNFDFILKNIDFFMTHDLSTFPGYLLWFNSAAEGEIVQGTLEISTRIKEFSIEAKEYIHVISDQVMRGLIELDCKQNDKGVKLKKIYPKDADIPREYKKRLDDNFEIRTLDEIPVAVKITDKNAGMVNLNLEGKMDFSIGLIGEKESFRRWITAIFDYYWDLARPVL